MDRETFRGLDRLLEPIRRKLSLVASKAIVELVKDSIGLQGLQVSVLSGEVGDEDTEHMQPGGISHVPLAGSEGVFLSIGGVRDDGVVICVSHRAHRPKGGQAGETVVYNEGDHQSTIWIRQDGAIQITSADGAPVNINGVEIDNDGNVTAPGEITAKSASPGTSVTVTGHKHLTGTGPSNAPTAGT